MVCARCASMRCESRTNPAVDRVAHPLEDRAPIAIDVEQHDGLGDQAQLVPRHRLGKLVDGAETSWQHHEAVGQFREPCFAIVHGRNHLEASEAIVCNFGAHQLLGDHPDHFAIGGECSISDHAHQADVTTAVHQPDPTMGKS